MARLIASMSRGELESELQKGGKLIQFVYCISAAIVTIKHSTNTYLVPAGESGFPKALQWTLLTLLAGWWGIPWGPIYTVQAIWQNLRGGIDITLEAALVMGLNVHWDSVPGNRTDH
jgi:hypothetical protein